MRPVPFTFIPSGQIGIGTHYGTNGVTLQVQCQTHAVARQLDHFTLHGIGQTVDTNDTVADRNDGTFVTRFAFDIKLRNALFDQLGDFSGIQLHALIPQSRLQRIGHAIQFTADRAVDNEITGLDEHPAIKDASVLQFSFHFARETLFQRSLNIGFLLVGQFDRRNHVSPNFFVQFSLERDEFGNDRRQHTQATILGHHPDQVLTVFVELLTADTDKQLCQFFGSNGAFTRLCMVCVFAT